MWLPSSIVNSSLQRQQHKELLLQQKQRPHLQLQRQQH
jgi:hypothetical protein